LLNIIQGPGVTVVNDSLGNTTISSSVPPIPPVTSRTSAIFYTIDGGGAIISPGLKGQVNIPVSCTVTGWVLTSDVAGDAVVDVLRSTYGAFPTTSSITGSDTPTLVTTTQKNENLAISAWGSTALLAGDQLQFNVVSATSVTRLNLTLVLSIP
jgi:hypothetical protein